MVFFAAGAAGHRSALAKMKAEQEAVAKKLFKEREEHMAKAELELAKKKSEVAAELAAGKTHGSLVEAAAVNKQAALAKTKAEQEALAKKIAKENQEDMAKADLALAAQKEKQEAEVRLAAKKRAREMAAKANLVNRDVGWALIRYDRLRLRSFVIAASLL